MSFVVDWVNIIIGESFQDYSWIQDFEADFLWKVSLKIMNSVDYDRISDLFSVKIKTINIQTCNCDYFEGILQVFKIWVFKVQDFGNYELSPMYNS